LLSALANEPAYVFGCSIGALIGLDFALHYPEKLRKLVAHEPPLPSLLSEAEQAEFRQAQQKMAAAYQSQGAHAAVEQFASSMGVTVRSGRNVVVGQEQASPASAIHNREAFLRYDTRAAGMYRLDIDALKADHDKVVLAGGDASHESWPYHCTVVLAQELGTTVAEFPGNHSGFADHPQEFAEKLHQVLNA
jgi:pimeloyl-ACP methyl ester carboxylesterase